MEFSIVIHTEEEFDWHGGFNAQNTQVTHVEALQAVCTQMLQLGCCITFAIDYAFISSVDGKSMLQDFLDRYPDQIEIASHLHPWVTPPIGQTQGNIVEFDSYPGNLPASMEHKKLEVLTDTIEQALHVRPTVYLAGRYGVGINTYSILRELGYKYDLSITPFTDYRHQSGPDFSQYNNHTIERDGITCVPHSSGYISIFSSFTDYLNSDAGKLENLNGNILGKVILRLMAVKRVRLSAEGYNAREIRLLAASLKRIGIKHLIYSFHSSTCMLRGSPYSESESLLEQFKADNLQALEHLKGFACASKVIKN